MNPSIVRAFIAACLVLPAACGKHQGPGEITKKRVPREAIEERSKSQSAAAAWLGAHGNPKQILFGDLHVHTTFSPDAFARSLPMMQGEGVHPPADACDFARFCSQLDFWSINDHAEGLSLRHWNETKESIRQCNAVAGDPKNPDIVAFLGWEWTQVGATPEDHYGHKNVIFKETAEERVPKRPISALNGRLVAAIRERPPFLQRIQFPLRDWSERQAYFDFNTYQSELAEMELCPAGVDTRELPLDCAESAETPAELFEKLAQWGFEAIVIPHGNTWGLYTPPGSSWEKQLTKKQHDPERQTLIEVFSGHGNSEEYRDWNPIDYDEKGNPVCPEPTKDFLPCCWQAGEIVRKRCGDVPAEECERRVQQARLDYLHAGPAGRNTLPGTPVEEWLDCGQCRDCFLPSFNYIPTSSSQYALAISNFDDPANPSRFYFGFIASSDNHTARPGTGYKEYARRLMTEAAGARDASWDEFLRGGSMPSPSAESVRFENRVAAHGIEMLHAVDFERQASFFMTGGLVAVHSEGRNREAIWDALKRREVYATSGERILLWFDLLNAPEGELPMGSRVDLQTAPRFRVRAVGSFKQKPGCPDYSVTSLGKERLHRLCRGECYNPSDERYRITRIEVVRIRPQVRPDEPVRDLIEDPWRTFACAPEAVGCVVEFEDPDFTRDTIYYVRAIQEPTPAVNAAGLRCTYDTEGNCVSVKPCYGDYRTPYEEDCLAPNEERAWSSPIYVNVAS